LDDRFVVSGASLELAPDVVRQRHSQGAREYPLVERDPSTRAVGAEVGATAGDAATRIEQDAAVRCADDPDEVALLARRPARDARAARSAAIGDPTHAARTAATGPGPR